MTVPWLTPWSSRLFRKDSMTITVSVRYIDPVGVNTEVDERIRTEYLKEGYQETGKGLDLLTGIRHIDFEGDI